MICIKDRMHLPSQFRADYLATEASWHGHLAKADVGWRMCLTMAATAGARTQDSDKGEVEFLLNCAGCRRWKRLWPLSAKLDSKPTDLTLMAKHDHGTFDAGAIYQKIEGRNERASHHNAEMPIWGCRHQSSPPPTLPSTTNPIKNTKKTFVADKAARNGA